MRKKEEKKRRDGEAHQALLRRLWKTGGYQVALSGRARALARGRTRTRVCLPPRNRGKPSELVARE